MAEAMAMKGIFDENLHIEDDLWFAVQEMVIFGKWHANRRSYVVQQWGHLKDALSVVDTYLIGLQHEEVHRVAAESAPALVAAATAIVQRRCQRGRPRWMRRSSEPAWQSVNHLVGCTPIWASTRWRGRCTRSGARWVMSTPTRSGL